MDHVAEFSAYGFYRGGKLFLIPQRRVSGFERLIHRVKEPKPVCSGQALAVACAGRYTLGNRAVYRPFGLVRRENSDGIFRTWRGMPTVIPRGRPPLIGDRDGSLDQCEPQFHLS